MNLSLEEARLIAIYRAVEKAGDGTFVKPNSAGTLLEFLTSLVDLDELDKKPEAEIQSYLEGVVTGYLVARLEFADVTPDQIQRIEEVPKPEVIAQTGVDPTTGKVRN